MNFMAFPGMLLPFSYAAYQTIQHFFIDKFLKKFKKR